MIKTKGQSLYELMIVVAIVSLVLIGIVSLSTKGLRNASFSADNAEATRYAQEAIEWIRQQRDEGWDNVYNRASTNGETWCLENLDWPSNQGDCSFQDIIPNTKFYRKAVLYKINVSNGGADPNQVKAEVEVYWNDSQGRQSVKVSSKFTNWRR